MLIIIKEWTFNIDGIILFSHADDAEGDSDADEIGTAYLVDANENKSARLTKNLESSPSKEITDIAAAALSIQPTGYTLETTHVSNHSLLRFISCQYN